MAFPQILLTLINAALFRECKEFNSLFLGDPKSTVLENTRIRSMYVFSDNENDYESHS